MVRMVKQHVLVPALKIRCIKLLFVVIVSLHQPVKIAIMFQLFAILDILWLALVNNVLHFVQTLRNCAL
jgi:hypothetical protein